LEPKQNSIIKSKIKVNYWRRWIYYWSRWSR